MTNKEKAIALICSLQTGDQEPAGCINPNKYIQHNLSVADGLEGFGAILKNAPEGGFKAEVVRAFEDGDFVVTHTIYDFFGPKIGFDVFRFEDGLIVEHWDNLIPITPPNPSGHTQTDGVTKISDRDKTEENRVLVSNFLNTVLVGGSFDKLSDFISTETYIQHNPDIADGLSGLGKAVEQMSAQGIQMVYSKVHKVLAEGDFVFSMSEGKFAGKHTAYYDLFRVSNGKIVEHWDVMATIPPEDEWKNNNGKF